MDPYAEFAKRLRALPPGALLREGEVLAAGKKGGQATLRVLGDGLALEKGDLRVNPLFRWDWREEEDNGQVEFLRAKDRVLLLTVDRQVYYLLCKVVRP